MATAVVAALTSTAFAQSSATNPWYLNYNTEIADIGGGATPTTTGLVVNGVDGALTSDITLTGLTFANDGKQDTDNKGKTITIGSGVTDFSVLIVQNDVSSTGAFGIGIPTPTAGTPKLTSLTGLTVSGATLNFEKSTATTNALSIVLTGTGSILTGVELVGIDLSDGGTYIGATAAKPDVITITSTDADATAQKIGNGSYTFSGGANQATATSNVTAGFDGSSLAATGALITTGSLSDSEATSGATVSGSVVLTGLTNTKGLKASTTATGVSLAGGTVNFTQTTDTAVVITGSVTTVAGYTGTATAYGANLNGGTFKVTSGTTTTTITGTVDLATTLVAGEANAYGISSVGANVEVTAGGETSAEISGTVGKTGTFNGEASAYGVFASGISNITINGGENQTTVQGQIGSATAQLATESAVTQTAAGLWVEGASTVTVNGGKGGIQITGKNQNTVTAEDLNGQINVYGVNVVGESTLTFTGKVTIDATTTDLSLVPEKQAGQYTVFGLSSTSSDIIITGENAGDGVAATAVEVKTGNASLNGGTLSIYGTKAGEAAGVDAGLKVTAGNLSLKGLTSVELQAGDSATGLEGGDATIEVAGTGTLTIADSTISLLGGAASSNQAGGNASISANGMTTITGSGITLTGGAKNGSNAGGTANATFTGGLTMGYANGQVDTSSIEVGAGNTLKIGGGADTVSNIYSGAYITIADGATLNLQGAAAESASLTIGEGATLTLGQKSTVTTSNFTTNIAGTLAINGTSKTDEEVPGSGPYAGGLGTMNVTGTVTTTDGSELYLQLKSGSAPDVLTFDGGKMTAAQVGVGTGGAAGTAASLVVKDGSEVSIGDLTVGAATTTGTVQVQGGTLAVDQLTITGANNKVTVSGDGYLILSGPTTEGGETTPNLSIDQEGGLVLTGGTLVTNSQNLWDQSASTQIAEGESLGNYFFAQGTTKANGITTGNGAIELTDKTVEASWLKAAAAQVGTSPLVLDGQLVSQKKPVNLMPTQPAQGSGTLPKDALVVGSDDIGGASMLLGNTLNANYYETKPEAAGGKTVKYQNLIIGANKEPNAKVFPWPQPAGTTEWTIDVSAGTPDTVGFANIDIGNNGYILVTGGDTLVLAGNTEEIVSGNDVNLYVGTQETTPTAENTGTLVLGYTPTSALGGTLNGNVTVYDGSIQVNYGPYVITGALTLGQEKTNTYLATPGNLSVANKGSLTVGSITGTNVGTQTVAGISVTGKSTLTVEGDMNVILTNLGDGAPDGVNEEFLVEDSKLIVNDLTISSTPKAQPVIMVASGSTVTAANLSATNTTIGFAGSTVGISGSLNQSPFEGTTGANTLILAVVSDSGTGSELTVSQNLTSTASTVWINDSTINVGQTITLGQLDQGTTAAPNTKLVIDGATISAQNIVLNNVVTGLFVPAQATQDPEELVELATYQSFYQSGDITATGNMNLEGSTIALNNGSLTVNGTLSVDAESVLSLGGITPTAFEAIPEANQPTALVTEASVGTLNLTGGLEINGMASEAGVQSKVAIGFLNLVNDTTEETGGDLVVGGKAALMLGSNKVADLSERITALNANKPATMTAAITNYFVAGQSVDIGDYNSVTIGDTIGGAKPTAVLTIGDGVAVAVDGKLLASSLQDGKVSLFNYAGTAAEAPAAAISQTAYFFVTNPLGNMEINVAGGFDNEGTELFNSQLTKVNPLYDVQWKQVTQDQNDLGTKAADETEEEPVESTIIAVTVNEEAVRGLGTLVPNSLIEAPNLHYNPNAPADEGANLLLNIMAGVVDTTESYTQARNQINSIALRGAAAHAHEIGISAASMVVDSVWDHGSKLAAAPHEEAKGDVWITLDWNHSRANDYKAGGLDNGYKLDLYGTTFGADYDFANGLAAGLAVSVGGGEAKSKGFNAGQKTDVTYWGINLYGTYASPIVNVIGNVGYIGIKNKTKIGSDKGRPDANIWTIGVKAEKDFAINEQFTVTPHVGIRYLSVDVDDFNLKGFHYGTDKANLVQFPIGVAFAANLKTANGAAVKPFLDLSFVPTAGDKNVDNTFGIQGGNASDVIDTTIASGAMFQGKIGVNASYGAHNFGLNFAIGGGNKGRLDTGLQAKYRFVF